MDPLLKKLENLSEDTKKMKTTKKESSPSRRLRVGINGFGRIGRAFTRIALQRDSFDIVAINTRKPQNEHRDIGVRKIRTAIQ
jgi:lactate dehydrogenase-like 2-hydroxyacid dehydrogenase